MLAQILLTIVKCVLSSNSQAKNPLSHRRVLRLESLESRELMAADVFETSLVQTHTVVELSDRTVFCDTANETAPCAAAGADNVAASWQNPMRPLDVNNDGVATPVDALIVVNDLNLNGARELPPENPQTVDPRYVDVNGDGFVSPVDALQVTNHFYTSIGIGEGSRIFFGVPAAETQVPIIEDPFTESDESVLVQLLQVSGAAIGMAPAGNHTVVTILGNDPFVGPLRQSQTDSMRSVDLVFSAIGELDDCLSEELGACFLV